MEDDLKISSSDLHRANVEEIQLNTLPFYPDVGIQDYTKEHSDHMWYPGDRKHYDTEEKYDFAQRNW